MTDPVNPNAYDDARYLEICNIMANDAAISRYVSELWMAGATEQNIKDEFSDVIASNIAEIAPGVSKTYTPGSPKRAHPSTPEEVIDEHTGQRSDTAE